MKIDKKWLWVILGLLVVFFAGWMVLRWWNRDVVSVKTVIAARTSIEQIISASGIVDAPVYDLGPKMGGKIVKINVREGQYVSAGMTLAEFDDTTRLVAPSDGLVAKINYDEGETVVPGQPAIVVVNYTRSWVNAQIDEIDIANIKVGDKVKITSDVYSDKVFEGEIYWIAPLAELRKVGGRIKIDEESYVFPCKIKFLGSHSELKINMSVNADITTKRHENTVIVPREAILSVDDSSMAYVIRKDRAYETKINIGIRSFTSVEALSGVNEGDMIAISNVAKLKDKARVKIEK